MSVVTSLPEYLRDLPVSPASAVKTQGWRGITRTLGISGKLLVTNHSEPQAVILTPTEYARLIEAGRLDTQQDPLALLRRQFDLALGALEADDAGDRLRDLMAVPGTLSGKVKAGVTY